METFLFLKYNTYLHHFYQFVFTLTLHGWYWKFVLNCAKQKTYIISRLIFYGWNWLNTCSIFHSYSLSLWYPSCEILLTFYILSILYYFYLFQFMRLSWLATSWVELFLFSVVSFVVKLFILIFLAYFRGEAKKLQRELWLVVIWK